MSRLEKNKLFEKLLDGSISREEMHTLNQYALDDDFLFDAIEGVSTNDFAAKETRDELALRLTKRSQGKKRKSILWIATAAASIAILVIALFTFNPIANEPMADIVTEYPDPTANSQVIEVEEGLNKEEVLAEQDQVPSESFSNTQQAKQRPEQNVVSAENEAEPKQPSFSAAEEIASDVKANERLEAIQEYQREKNKEAGLAAIATEESKAEDLNTYSDEQSKVLAGQNQEYTPTPIATRSDAATSEPETDQGIALDEVAINRSKKAKVELTNAAKPSFSKFDRQAAPKLDDNGVDQPSLGASLPLKFIIIEDDPVNTLAFSNFISEKIDLDSQNAIFKASWTLEYGKIADQVLVTSSVNADLDAKIVQLIEKYQEWRGSGNKNLIITFNKE